LTTENELADSYSIFGITVDRKHNVKWLFPQEKATFHCSQKDYMYSENALKTASFRLRRFCKPLNNHELAPPQAQKCNNCFVRFRLLDQKSKSGKSHRFNNITNQQGRTKDKRRAKPKRGIPGVSPLHFETRECILHRDRISNTMALYYRHSSVLLHLGIDLISLV